MLCDVNDRRGVFQNLRAELIGQLDSSTRKSCGVRGGNVMFQD